MYLWVLGHNRVVLTPLRRKHKAKTIQGGKKKKIQLQERVTLATTVVVSSSSFSSIHKCLSGAAANIVERNAAAFLLFSLGFSFIVALRARGEITQV